MRTIDKIIDRVDTSRGAPMGRSSIFPKSFTIADILQPRDFLCDKSADKAKKIFDCAVPMSDGAYDKGGAYWGIGRQVRVSYTKDLTYVKFYRLGDK